MSETSKPKSSTKSTRQSRAITLSPTAWAALGVVIAAFFGCISASLTALVPEIGQAVRQGFPQPASQTTVPSAPSAAPASPFTGTPTAHILKPLYTDGRTPVQTNVTIEYDSIPEGKFLWVVVRIPKVKPNWKIYPQLLNGIPKSVTGKGKLEMLVQLGSADEDIGDPFNVVVLLLDEKANQTFVEYSEKCINPPNDCSGINLPTSGAEILDFITLVRK